MEQINRMDTEIVSTVLVIAWVVSPILLFYLLQRKNKKLRAMKDEVSRITQQLDATTEELQVYAPIKDVDAEYARRKQEYDTEVAKLAHAAQESKLSLEQVLSELAGYELKLELEETAFYQPKFEFEDDLQYADALEIVREAQKELIRQKRHLDGSSATPASARHIGKLAIAAFNGEASSIIEKVTYKNFEASKSKLSAYFEKTNKLLEPLTIQMSPKYLELKIKEMALAYDYREALQKAKEQQAELKAQMKEEEAARAEAEKLREKAIQEQERYQAALEHARTELDSKSAEERDALEQQIRKLEEQLRTATEERERATSMAQITKKGHVYIISNIGSFGDNVFKIGMTRRVNPLDRVKELGDASVPFGFDIHAMVNAEDAPALENALHNHFGNYRVNKVNMRKEFFRISIDDLDRACKELGHSIELTKMAEAREYRESQQTEVTDSARPSI